MLRLETFKRLVDLYSVDLNKFDAWKDIIGDYESYEIETAIKQYSRTSSKIPSPSDIIKIIKSNLEKKQEETQRESNSQWDRKAELETLYQETVRAESKVYVVCLEKRENCTVRSWLHSGMLPHFQGYFKTAYNSDGVPFRVFLLNN